MRVLGMQIGRSKPPQGASGAAGQTIIGQAITELLDPNPIFNGPAKYLIYDEMRHTNPAVRSSLWMIKLPLRSAVVDFEPASKDGLDQLVADACRWQFGVGGEEGQMDRSWDEQLEQKLRLLDWGAQFEEDLWSPDVATWLDKDGDEHAMWRLVATEQRPPASVNWNGIKKDPATRGIAELSQNLPGTSPIPGEKLSAYVLEREGDNWFGTSLLRPMWAPWRMQKGLMTAAGVAWDHFGSKTPAIYHPQGQAAKASAIGRDYRTNQRGFFVFEGPPPGYSNQPPNWEIQMLGPDALADPVPLLRWYSEQIAVAALQQFSSLGTGHTGNRAVGQVLIEPFSQACVALATSVASVMHRGPVRRFVDFNFGTQVPAPRLRFSKIQMRGFDALATAVADLANAGLEFSDLDTQNDIRSSLSLPILDALPENVGVAPTPPGANNGEGGLSASDRAALAASRGAPAK
jgi:hypothetical protein